MLQVATFQAAIYWLLEENEVWVRATSRPKVMISLEFLLVWQRSRHDARTLLTSKMKTKKTMPTTIFWPSLSYLKAMQSRTIFSATLQTKPCGLSMVAATSGKWVLTLLLCTKQDRVLNAGQATPTQRKTTMQRRQHSRFNSSGDALAVTDSPSLDTLLTFSSRLRKAVTWSEEMALRTIICTTTTWRSKWDKTCLKRRHSLQQFTLEVASIHLVAMMLMTRCNSTLVSTMISNKIAGSTLQCRDLTEVLSTNCTSKDLKAVAAFSTKTLSTYLEATVAIWALSTPLKGSIWTRRRFSRWTCLSHLPYAASNPWRYRLPKSFWSVA